MYDVMIWGGGGGGLQSRVSWVVGIRVLRS